MGGAAAVGNATAVGRVQRLARPRGGRDRAGAAAELGVPVTMYGLDVFYDVAGVLRAGRRSCVGDEPGRRSSRGGSLLHQCERFGGSDATRSATPARSAPSSPPTR